MLGTGGAGLSLLCRDGAESTVYCTASGLQKQDIPPQATTTKLDEAVDYYFLFFPLFSSPIIKASALQLPTMIHESFVLPARKYCKTLP